MKNIMYDTILEELRSDWYFAIIRFDEHVKVSIDEVVEELDKITLKDMYVKAEETRGSARFIYIYECILEAIEENTEWTLINGYLYKEEIETEEETDE
jgi:hypothetical protein